MLRKITRSLNDIPIFDSFLSISDFPADGPILLICYREEKESTKLWSKLAEEK